MLKLLMLLTVIFSMNALAGDSRKEYFCNGLKKSALASMEKRQEGVSLPDMLTEIKNETEGTLKSIREHVREVQEGLAKQAHKFPLYSTKSEKDKSIKEFAHFHYSSCMGG